MKPCDILIVEDEKHARTGLISTLVALGHPRPVACATLAEARAALAAGGISLVLLDLHLPDGNGETLLEELTARMPEVPVLVITAAQDTRTTVRCMRAGAIDYLVKPIDQLALETAVNRALASTALLRSNRALAALSRDVALADPEAFAEMITFDPGMLRVMRHAELVAGNAAPVLISGEAGTGKRLLASIIHRLSGLTGQLTVVPGAGIADTTALPRTGSLVIDQIERMPSSGQIALLARLRRQDLPVRHIITAGGDVDGFVRDGAMRPDLTHLLRRHHLVMPALRERPGDIAVLVHHIASQWASQQGVARPRITDAWIRHCQGQSWPGNIRQLASDMSAALSSGDLAPPPQKSHSAAASAVNLPTPLPTIDGMRDILIAEALRRCDGNLARASQMLGISRWGLCKRLRQNDDK